MSHHIYQTESFVIDSVNFKEADKIITLFTKDLGLIQARATGVRLLQSKLRYSLQDYSYAKISLVRGREVWRLTSAGSTYNIVSKISPESFVFARALSLVKRLVHGEEKNEHLWQTLYSALEFLKTREIDMVNPDYVEWILILRILYALGYVAPNQKTESFLKDSEWSQLLINEAPNSRKSIIFSINEALKQSQL